MHEEKHEGDDVNECDERETLENELLNDVPSEEEAIDLEGAEESTEGHPPNPNIVHVDTDRESSENVEVPSGQGKAKVVQGESGNKVQQEGTTNVVFSSHHRIRYELTCLSVESQVEQDVPWQD